MIMLKVQELIHRFEVGAGAKVIRWIFIGSVFAAIALLYNTLCFRNFSTPAAMDAAQVARNLAQGKGFTTDYVRPFSMFLLSRHRADHSTMLKEGHPDLANPPLYPLILAAVLKFIPEQDLNAPRIFSIARADLIVAIANEIFLLFCLVLVFRLARLWFDSTIASVAAILFALTELYWRYSVSGLSTNLAMLLLLLLVWALSRMEESNRLLSAGGRSLAFAALAGFLLGCLTMTRYSAGWLLLPVLAYTWLFMTPRRALSLAAVFIAFLLVAAPWIARNILVSGTPFGTAGYAIMEQTRLFPEDQLMRTLHPDISVMPVGEYVRKLIVQGRDVITTDVPKMGGSWIWGLFMAGLLIPFRNVGLSRSRWLVLLMLVILVPVQALGKTQQWADSPELNGENLLVVISPLILIFGVSAFFVLTDALTAGAAPALRYAVWSVFAGVMSLPLLLTVMPPHPTPVVYPPYFPPFIQRMGLWLDKDSMVMTDIPAAMAWYGHRQAVLLTPSWRDEFAEIHDFHKPVNALYLTARTTGQTGLGPWMAGDTNSWHAFVVQLRSRLEVPTGFPLRAARDYFAQGQILLMDYDRWRVTSK